MEPIKRFLVKLGAILGEKGIFALNLSMNYLEVGHWIKKNGFHAGKLVDDRRELFHEVAARVADKKVLYLEFGVSSGRSMRYWSNLLKNPDSHLHGFDTFEGLPLAWQRGTKGIYTQHGKPPQIKDERIRFIVGLFEDTLPDYIPPAEYEALVINIDCDLYTSTNIALNSLAKYIGPGAFIYFDEFPDRSHELRAFDDFLVSTGKRFKLLGATKSYGQVVFQCC